MKEKRLFIVSLIVSMMFFVFVCSNGQDKATGIFYDSEKHIIVGNEYEGNRLIPESFDELESRVRDDPYGVIVEATVAGPSINRIIEPLEEECDLTKVYGVNHVLTPIKIEKIIYAGTAAKIEENENYFLAEPYFYITELSEPYYSTYGADNVVYAEEYTPMEKEFRYILYLNYRDNEIYNYEGEAVLSTVGLQEAVYCLGNVETIKENIAYDNADYWRLWDEVKKQYE